jgi:hypothetical protein
VDALAAGHAAAVQDTDTFAVSVRLHGAGISGNDQIDFGRSRGDRITNYLAFIKLVSIRIWLRAHESMH